MSPRMAHFNDTERLLLRCLTTVRRNHSDPLESQDMTPVQMSIGNRLLWVAFTLLLFVGVIVFIGPSVLVQRIHAQSQATTATVRAYQFGQIGDTTPARAAIWVDQATLVRLKAKAAANDPDWVVLKAGADQLTRLTVLPYDRNAGSSATTIGYAYQGEGWWGAVFSLAFAYEVTGNAAYANKVREIVSVINLETKKGNLQPVSVDAGFPTRFLPLSLGLAYAWCGDRFTAAEKADTFATINQWFDAYKTSPGIIDKDGPVFSNYFGGHLAGFGIAGLATAGENPRGREIADYMRARFEQVNMAFASGVFAGGYPLEGYTYGTNHFVRILQYAAAVRTATGEDLLGPNTANKIVRSLIYNLKPNRWQFPDEADNPGDYTGIMDQTLTTMLTSMASGNEAGYVQFFLQHLAPGPANIPAGAAIKLLWGGSVAPIDYRSALPLFYNSPGDEHLYIRSSWGDDAVWASFKASAQHLGSSGDTHGHDMRGAGHISIQRGNDYLLVNSGQWKGQNGWGGNPSAYDLRSWRTNTLFYQNPWGPNYQGAQGFWGTKNIIAYEETPDYVYKKSDLTSAYNLQGAVALKSFVRSFVSVGNGNFLLSDRIEAGNATDEKKLYFHFNRNGIPKVNGNVVTSTVGESRLFVKTMLPANPVILVVPDPVSDADPTAITYRTEVSDSVASQDLIALHQISATASTVTEIPDAGPITVPARNMFGAAIMSGTPKFVLFAATASPQTSVTYSTARAGLHLLLDMASNKTLVVDLDGTMLKSVKVSSQGVASFSAPSGGVFRVEEPSSRVTRQAEPARPPSAR